MLAYIKSLYLGLMFTWKNSSLEGLSNFITFQFKWMSDTQNTQYIVYIQCVDNYKLAIGVFRNYNKKKYVRNNFLPWIWTSLLKIFGAWDLCLVLFYPSEMNKVTYNLLLLLHTFRIYLHY